MFPCAHLFSVSRADGADTHVRGRRASARDHSVRYVITVDGSESRQSIQASEITTQINKNAANKHVLSVFFNGIRCNWKAARICKDSNFFFDDSSCESSSTARFSTHKGVDINNGNCRIN